MNLETEGIWSSFTAAYSPDLPAVLAGWLRYLRPGGWIALTEVDDLFGHGPVSVRTTAVFERYARDALDAERYDFHMGRKLRGYLERSGLTVSKMLQVGDQELSFFGPARPEVVDAWQRRLDRMTLLRDFCGSGFAPLCDEFLGCLLRADHHCVAGVYCCIGTK